jgi:hypothetical protein
MTKFTKLLKLLESTLFTEEDFSYFKTPSGASVSFYLDYAGDVIFKTSTHSYYTRNEFLNFCNNHLSTTARTKAELFYVDERGIFYDHLEFCIEGDSLLVTYED